jgi:hypothetical protein
MQMQIRRHGIAQLDARRGDMQGVPALGEAT